MLVLALAWEHHGLALLLIIPEPAGRRTDGIVARLIQPIDAGAYLDIVLDFLHRAVCGFAWADPA